MCTADPLVQEKKCYLFFMHSASRYIKQQRVTCLNVAPSYIAAYLPLVCRLSAGQARHSSSFWLSFSSIVPAYRTSSPLQLGAAAPGAPAPGSGGEKGAQRRRRSPRGRTRTRTRTRSRRRPRGGSGGAPSPAPTGDGPQAAPRPPEPRRSRAALGKATFPTRLQA